MENVSQTSLGAASSVTRTGPLDMGQRNTHLGLLLGRVVRLLRHPRNMRDQTAVEPEPEPGFICTKVEQHALVKWASEKHGSFITNGKSRRFQKISQCMDIPPAAHTIRNRIIGQEGLNECRAPRLGDFVSHISDGGQIQSHTDPNAEGLIHIRFNVFLQLPVQGGRPIYGGTRLDPLERSYLPCVAGRDPHTCEMVVGPMARIALSFGFLVTQEWLVNRGV